MIGVLSQDVEIILRSVIASGNHALPVRVAARGHCSSEALCPNDRNRGKNYVWLDPSVRGILVFYNPQSPSVSFKQDSARISKWNLGRVVSIGYPPVALRQFVIYDNAPRVSGTPEPCAVRIAAQAD
ncbi:unnamed protein product [Prunus armeniaca]